jgi:amidohydrolase
MDMSGIKSRLAREVDNHREALSSISRRLHDNPETAFQEKLASGVLIEFLESNGFAVERGICGLETAFSAVYGSGRPVVAFLAEYDALPSVGHACLCSMPKPIDIASMAAAVAAKLAVKDSGGTIMVFGTPGEELMGGKAIMAERGAFKDIDFALLCHPGGGNSAVMNTIACETLYVEFFGKAAHAGSEPEKGINALEAMIQSYNGVNSLRQHIRETARIHGVITNGGEAANVVPAYTAGTFIVRAEDDTYLEEVKEKVINCFHGAAQATGARLEHRWGEHYAAMRSNVAMARLFKQNMESLGRKINWGRTSCRPSARTSAMSAGWYRPSSRSYPSHRMISSSTHRTSARPPPR